MKKRFFGILIIVLALVCANTLIACIESTSKTELSYGKRYIHERYTGKNPDAQVYYKFEKNGTGVCNYNYNGGMHVINFKYLIIEETVICFYDSVENNNADISSDWTITLGFSKDILMGISGVIYICEDYLENIPNFGK